MNKGGETNVGLKEIRSGLFRFSMNFTFLKSILNVLLLPKPISTVSIFDIV